MNASLSSLFRPRALVIDSARAPLDSALAMRPAPLHCFECMELRPVLTQQKCCFAPKMFAHWNCKRKSLKFLV